MTDPRPDLAAESVLDLVGHTPLVRLRRIPPAGSAQIFGKLESLNPSGSVKDRIALNMVQAAERDGRLHPGDTIVEPTSGNTGIGLAMVAAVKGYRCIITMPEDYSLERRKLLTRFGAELVLTPAIEGMSGAVYAAEKLVGENSGYFMPQQFLNPDNPEAHRNTTGPEILRATGGEIDAFVAGVGTGGTITGVSAVLKTARPGCLIVAVEPARSRVLAGKRPGLHGIQGIGAGFVPGVLDRGAYDELLAVGDEEAMDMMGRLAREEGLLVGISSGANVAAALTVARRLGESKTVVTMLCDTGERYLSALP
jgi:cysteine synthase A